MNDIREHHQLNKISIDYSALALICFRAPVFVFLLVTSFTAHAVCPPPVKDFHQPECINSIDGLLDVELDMHTSTIDIGPKKLNIATHNDSLPGPTLQWLDTSRLFSRTRPTRRSG